MNNLNTATAVAVIMTILVLYALGATPYIPAWAVFISWACFFHMDGGTDPGKAFASTLQHVELGIVAAWLSALLVLLNPFSNAVMMEWWAPVVIGLAIGVLFQMSMFARFSITPAIIYGYAGTFAFLGSGPGRLSAEALLSLSFENVLITLSTCLLVGVSAGYLNAVLVQWLSSMSLRKG